MPVVVVHDVGAIFFVGRRGRSGGKMTVKSDREICFERMNMWIRSKDRT